MAGRNQLVLTRLLTQMKKHSDEMRFEKAAEVKELVDLILAQVQKSSLLAEPVNRAEVLMEIQEGNSSFDYILLVAGRVYIRGYYINPQRNFNDALVEYYEGVVDRSAVPDSEDLEKIKITLNWAIRNRHQVSLYYLKQYKSLPALQSVLQADLNSRIITIPELSLSTEDAGFAGDISL
jgi:DNA polymerase-3 subunit epsilon